MIEYNSDLDGNAEIGRKLRAAGIPVLAVNYPVPGAPFYGADNLAAGRIAGEALGEFARQNWTDQSVVAVIAGDLGDTATYIAQRVQGITEGLRKHLPDVALTQLDTSGNAVKLEGRWANSCCHRRGVKCWLQRSTIRPRLPQRERSSGRHAWATASSSVKVVDKNIHGGANDKKEIDPSNRGSIILGSVAYYVDRYGYEVLPLAMKILQGNEVPKRTITQHILVSGKNVFTEYPPTT